MSNDRYEKIRKALEMGPTPGPCSVSRSHSSGNQELIIYLTYKDEYGITENYCTVRNRLGDTWKTEANAALIAACDPDTIRELLAEHDQLAAENARLREDAERYRLLRKGAVEDVAVVRGLGAMDYGMSAVVATYSEEIDGDDLDAAIDAALSKEPSHEHGH